MKSLTFKNTPEALKTLQMATDAANLGVWDLDVLSGELNWSERCREVFGVSLEARLRDEDFLHFLDELDRDVVDAAVQSALRPDGPGEYDIEYRIRRPDNETRWVAASLTRVRSDSPKER